MTHYTTLVQRCRSTNSLLADDMEKAFRRLERERDAWKDTAAQHLRNEEYYRGLVEKCGEHFGDAAKMQDDGNMNEDILCAKVPELVADAAEKAWRYSELSK